MKFVMTYPEKGNALLFITPKSFARMAIQTYRNTQCRRSNSNTVKRPNAQTPPEGSSIGWNSNVTSTNQHHLLASRRT